MPFLTWEGTSESMMSTVVGRLCRDVTPAARFLYPIQYNAILLKVTEV